MPIRYAVGKQKVVRHGNLEGAKPVIVWIPDEYFGLHDTAIAAKRAFAPGDEYVIVDSAYLPISVTSVTK